MSHPFRLFIEGIRCKLANTLLDLCATGHLDPRHTVQAVIWWLNGRQANGDPTPLEPLAPPPPPEAFKAYVHAQLDALGVPHDPAPERTATTGCRIENRLQYLADQAGMQWVPAAEVLPGLGVNEPVIMQIGGTPPSGDEIL